MPPFNRVKGLVSVVIPFYNASSYVKQCLDSIAEQTYRNLEIILVNDGSVDESLVVIESWMKQEKIKGRFTDEDRVTVLNLPYNIGYAGAYTTGFFLARGEFIAVQDADDFSHPTRLEKQVHFLKNQSTIGMVGTNLAEFRSGNLKKMYTASWIQYGLENIKEKYQMGHSAFCHGTLLFRGEVFDQIGGPVRELPQNRKITGHDYLFIYKCIQQGINIDNIPEVLYYYRLHPAQMSGRGKKYLK